ncbi:efflux RND transporter permease subunit [Candidatus Obscuribacterales bacterium]|nr:efflux RND transporter permease subunit [Candidatus Obscuribacterales bacterium]MBX3151373.1 efflux RND transporter permease subunit [Candidatus Obscuribacterales bacterium]
MIDNLIRVALKQRLLTLIVAVGVVAFGIWSMLNIPIDSFPDVSNVQVQIITEPESMATEEIELLITFPIENALNGLPKIKQIRSSSSFGLSVVTAIFDDDTDVYFARQLVQQRLMQIESSLPQRVRRPELGPVISSFSQVYMYSLESDHLNNTELRTIQDWDIARKLRTVPGVANVGSFGGFVKQYQLIIHPMQLRKFGIKLADVVRIVAANNDNIGGNFIEEAGEEVVIRGVGRIKTLDDIKNIVLKEYSGTPIKVSQVADVTIGEAFRRGSASKDGRGETVIGIVYTRKGVNTKAVVEHVKEKVEEIRRELPPSVKLVAFYDQTELVEKTIETVKEILFFSGGLVIVILTAVLLHIPSALIVSVIIPISLLFSFILMKYTGLTANLMTLGAVDFGVIVDAGVVMVENIYRHLSKAWHSSEKVNTFEVVLNAAREVGRPVVFAISIIIAVHLPLFALEGIEGKMFQPLALTFIYAITGSLLCSLTIIPVLCFWVLRGKIVERENPAVVWIANKYIPVLNFALDKPKLVIGASLACLAASFCLLPFLGSEFIPTLDEGSILVRTKMPASVSHTNSRRYAESIEKVLMEFPEVEVVVSRTGRPTNGPGLDGVDASDFYVGLKPLNTWKTAHSKEELINKMSARLESIPGVSYSFSQPIADMIDDLVAGIRADLGIKIFGDDEKVLAKLAEEIQGEISSVRGAVDLQREHLLGLPELQIEVDRRAIARFGLNSDDVLGILRVALAGDSVTEVIEAYRRFGVLVRYDKLYRDSPQDIAEIAVDTPTGARIPLDQLSKFVRSRGLVTINREDGQRRTAVLANVRNRDLGSFVAEAQERVAKNVKIPKGYKIVWSGQFENQRKAMERLSIVVPIVLGLIFILLFSSFNSIKNAALIMLNVPFALIGGIVGLFVSQQTLSVPAIIGFIALFGVAVQNGVIMLSYIMQLQTRGVEIREAIVQGATTRLRPVLMTALVATMGLLPKIFSHGTGAEVQRPLATVVFGGLLTATAMTLVVLPTLYRITNQKDADDSSKPV